MRISLIYFPFLLILLSSCEEYYNPVIDITEGQLVVEAVITNDPSRNFVHLTKSRSFYDETPPEAVSGARVELVEINSKVFQGVESGPGNFNFNTVPVAGKNYKLRVLVRKDTYESEVVTMPPLPTISNFYTGHKESKIYVTDGYGFPQAFNVIGREIYADASVTSSLSYYRFDVRSVLEWTWDSTVTSAPPPPTMYGWISFQNDKFNLAGPKIFSQTEKIEKHPLLMVSYNAKDYLHSDTLISNGWILIIDQFGTSKGSYEYHEKLNSQFAADGSLFDPVQTQIYGNITCKTDPAKMVFGYFDLNSYRQYRYYLNLSSPMSAVTLRQIFRYPFIPDFGQTREGIPDWWER